MSRDRESRGRGKRPEAPEEDFASRWSRMKRGTRAAPAAEPRPEAQPADERSDEEILSELGLPDPETLKPGDDVKGFMASAVPARIRNRVLRRLWISNPVLANLDGLVDYGEDFTDAAMVPAVLQTAYKVGRGWARDTVEEQAEGEAEGETETTPAEPPERADDKAPEAGEPQTAPSQAEAKAGGESEEHPPPCQADTVADAEADIGRGGEHAGRHVRRQPADVASRPAIRRMRFRFADG